MNDIDGLLRAEKRFLIAKLRADLSGSRSRRKPESPIYLTDEEVSAFLFGDRSGNKKIGLEDRRARRSGNLQ